MVSVFETTIRVLGGLLSAFDLSRDQVKAPSRPQKRPPPDVKTLPISEEDLLYLYDVHPVPCFTVAMRALHVLYTCDVHNPAIMIRYMLIHMNARLDVCLVTADTFCGYSSRCRGYSRRYVAVACTVPLSWQPEAAESLRFPCHGITFGSATKKN